MGRTTRLAFLLLVLAQSAHSAEEYLFRLYDVFAPARLVSEMFGFDPPTGFLLANGALILFGVWCWFARVRSQHRSARAFAWFWALLEMANGLGHIALAVSAGGYFPGVATAPVLLAIGGSLGFLLGKSQPA